MRIYSSFEEAYDEIKRNVGELGTRTELYSMQDKIVEGDPDWGVTKELIGETYQLVNVRSQEVLDYMKKNGYSIEWVEGEFKERISEDFVNPGEAWKHRKEVWDEFLKKENGKFSYTYNERYRLSLKKVIDELKKHKTTRQAVLGMWDINKDPDRFATLRVPCSTMYQFLIRKNSKGEDELHIIYIMRSSDVIEHFVYDVCLTLMLQEHVAKEVGVKPGHFTHFIGSMHAYQKDLHGVF